jgi:hypothetical protein
VNQWRGAYPGQNYQAWPYEKHLTDCEACREIETPKPGLLAALAGAVAAWTAYHVTKPRGDAAVVADLGRGMSGMVAAAIGYTPPAPASEYDKHRDAWIETGDVMELERMTAHVEADA